jgi:hypothetical protein
MPAPREAPRARPSSPVVPITLIGVGAAVAIGGGVVYLLSSGKFDDLKKACETACPADALDQKSTINTMDSAALIMGIGGAVLAGVGGYLLVTRKSGVEVRAGYVGYRASF